MFFERNQSPDLSAFRDSMPPRRKASTDLVRQVPEETIRNQETALACN